MIQNSKGKIYYGMHFYPGLAQYEEPKKGPYKILLNEDVLRKMDPTFAGKPIFVEHVEEVESNLSELRKEADGWVIESFFNQADGKHWTKFISVSDNSERAIKNGYRLSNAYVPKMNGKGGLWNGIPYQNEVVDGEYEHLAIVKHPRYDESVIMTPEEFKTYNENLKLELTRISNSKETKKMKLKFWNRKPVENSVDLEGISVTLPTCGKEFTILQIVNAMDEAEEKKKENMADSKAMVKLHDGTMCNVADLVEKYKNKSEKEDEPKEPKEVENEDEDEDEKAKKKALELAEHEAKEIKEKKENKKMKNGVEPESGKHFNALKNAPLKFQNEAEYVDLPIDKVARGKSRYGSN